MSRVNSRDGTKILVRRSFQETRPNEGPLRCKNGRCPTLSISTEKICFVVLKAREFDVKDADTSSDEDGSNPADDRMVEVLENRPDDPVDQELVAFIEAMSEDEQVDLVTLTWLGRGNGGLEDWDDLRADAARVHNRRTASYLLGIPLLPDFLEEALAAFGRSCEEFEEDHL